MGGRAQVNDIADEVGALDGLGRWMGWRTQVNNTAGIAWGTGWIGAPKVK